MRARNQQQSADVISEEFRLIAAKPHIMWTFYNGYVSDTEIATGYNPEQHEGWCIPLYLWKKRTKISEQYWINEVKNSARKLRIIDDGVIKQNYADPKNDKWWILAPAPEANPIYGILVRAQPNNRDALISVPRGPKGTTNDLKQRVQLLKNEDENAKDYPAIDEVWVATLRVQPDGHVKVYPKGVDEAIPLLTLYRQMTNIKSRSTKFDHDPDQMIFGQFQVSPFAKSLPSTNTIPVQTFIPLSPDFLMVAALAISMASYLKRVQSGKVYNKNEADRDILPTTFADYSELKRDHDGDLL